MKPANWDAEGVGDLLEAGTKLVLVRRAISHLFRGYSRPIYSIT